MAERSPVIEIVEVHNYLSFRISPEEVRWAFDKYGIEPAKEEMLRQFEIAFDVAVKIYQQDND